MTVNGATDMYGWDVRNGALGWSRQRRPEPGTGEKLIKVAFSGLCGSDLAKLTSSPIPSPGHDWRPGHEIVGWDLDPSPHRLVTVNPLVTCGCCDRCRAGDIHLCPALRRVGWDLPGGFAEFVIAPERNILPLHADADPAHAVLADPLAVAIHGVRCGLDTRPPGRLGIIGSGALALGTAAYAAARQWQVTLLARDLTKLTPVVDHLDAAIVPLADTPARSFDAVIDAAAGRDDQPLRTALELVHDGGIVLVQTAYDPRVRLRGDLRDVFGRSLTIAGSFSFCQRHEPGDFAEALALLARRPTWADPMVRNRFPIGDLPAAISAVIDTAWHPRAIKTVLTTREAPEP